MVKGVTRQIVMVRAPEDALFEQAFFLVRSDVVGKDGITEETLLQQARHAAQRHGGAPLPGRAARRLYIGRLVCVLAGAGATGLVWLLTALL